MQENRSRRAFLRLEAPAQQDECHISSLLVHVRPERQQEAAALIAGLPGVELAQSPKPGKLILTLETANTFEIMERLEAINNMPGVVAAALVYHQWESAVAESESDHGSHPPELSQG
jgi:periplasmic nitrate reductase NapD